MKLYPLRFDPIYKEKVWGGRKLERFGHSLPDGLMGESWEIADLPITTRSGDGNASVSKVANGPLAGQSFRDLIKEFGPALIGTVPLIEGAFPLLIKFLDANQNVSVQVHPSAPYAEAHDDAHYKSEAWYVIQADANAAIYKGVREGVTPEQFRAAIARNDVEDLLIRIPVQAGDCHYVPSGTCHALGGGILVAEIQTSSDTTFRVFDWGRTDRELHIEQAMQCIDFGPPDVSRNELKTKFDQGPVVVEPLVNCEHFRIEKFTATQEASLPLQLNHQPAIWMILQGEVSISNESAAVQSTTAVSGQTLLLPATLDSATAQMKADTALLHITFPSAMANVIA